TIHSSFSQYMISNLYILRSCGAQFKIYSFVVFVFYTFVATPRYDLKLIHSW
ncbi:unnamed protein product, partial [Rotaria magnacalcarata]